MTRPLHYYMLYWLLSQVSMVTGTAVVSLVQTSYIVHEDAAEAEFTVQVQRTGAAASFISAAIQIINYAEHGGHDFVGTSQAIIIPPGTKQQVFDVTFTTNDDDSPEEDETFTFDLEVINGDGILGSLTTTTVTIVANDNAFGIFGFAQDEPEYVDEISGDHQVGVKVVRSAGVLGNVRLSFQVTGSEGGIAGDDIQPTVGLLEFSSGQPERYIQLTIKADLIPEEDEEFLVFLTGVTGGSSISQSASRPLINQSLSELQLVIRTNDAPIRFAQAEYRVDEGRHDNQLRLTVYRGLAEDGESFLGPLVNPATVAFELWSGTAVIGLDFIGVNGSVGFTAGSTETSMSITIRSDSLPEESEYFTVVLLDVSGDAVLVYPSQATVIISANDDPNGVLSLQTEGGLLYPTVQVNEDVQPAVAVFTVVRNGGSFGTVTVSWELVRNDSSGQPVAADVTPDSGTVIFGAGDREQQIVLSVEDDVTPESSQLYVIRLQPITATGGSRAEGILEGHLVIEDSDQAHGVVQLTRDEGQTLSTSTSPRRLYLSLERAGGTLGIVRVTFNVEYIVDEVVQTGPVFTSEMPASTSIPDGQTGHSFDVSIRDQTFLQVGGYFKVTLTDISLASASSVGPFTSPVLGDRVTVEVLVTSEAANGEVGLSSTQPQRIQEPETGSNTRKVMVPLKRDGTNGEVTVYWTITGSGAYGDHVTINDIRPMAGSVTMQSGQDEGQILLEVLPDADPETEEEVTLLLTRVEPTATQRLKPLAVQTRITIEENDQAGGMFSLATDTDPVYTLHEDQDSISLVVVRTGGALVTRFVEQYITPNGDAEFYGATNVLRFDPGEVEKSVTIIAKGDGVPELIEQFQLRLRGYGDLPGDIGGGIDVTNITVPANDHPYGVIHFMSNITYANETSDVNATAAVTVVRSMGRFGTVLVHWRLGDAVNSSMDLSPQTGSLTFNPGVGQMDILITVINDGLPEEDEEFLVHLYSTSNGAILGDDISTTLTVLKNDDAVYFKEPSTQRVSEPGLATFTVTRDGSTDMSASVRYRSLDGVALLAGADYQPVDGALLQFAPGERDKTITIQSLPDDQPEPDEQFYIELYDAKGEIAVYGMTIATIIIEANDGANGIFSFSSTDNVTIEEGVVTNFRVQRQIGVYYDVTVHWEILDLSTGQRVPDNQDFSESVGNVTVQDRQEYVDIPITPTPDGVPEFQEDFVLRLYEVTGGGPGNEIPELAEVDLEVTFTVVQNDDPYGLFAFAADSREVTVAEDFEDGDENSTFVDLYIERRQGTASVVKVGWEIFSYQLAAVGNLPPIIDMFFIAFVPPEVPEEPGLRRKGTGTPAYRFHGCEACFVTIAEEDQPPPSVLRGEFSLGAWFRGTQPVEGFLLSKTSPGGEQPYYSLKVETNNSPGVSSSTLTFIYRYDEGNAAVAQQINLDILDNEWHFLLITVENLQVVFYIDAVPREFGTLLGPVMDDTGMLLIGAAVPRESLLKGLLQDVRIFTRKLQAGEILELYQTPSADELTPISGYITFGPGVYQARVRVHVLQDEEEESRDLFAVKLVSAGGGPRLQEGEDISVITVLKSDNANGLFGFSGRCNPELSLEGDTFNCPVERLRGDADTVDLYWRVVEAPSDPDNITDATDDFEEARGLITFGPGDRIKMIKMTLIDDILPELSEDFTLMLTQAVSSDDVKGSTPTSGASILLAESTRSVSVTVSDHPYGLLQFSPGGAPPRPSDPPVLPATEGASVTVPEEAGTISLLVVRAGGLLGEVTAEWRTLDGTARSSGKTPPDFEAAVNVISLTPGERYTLINITLLDNDIPEGSKYFTVGIVNPTGGADVDVGSTITVNIQHSDQAYGVFQFENSSTILYVAEPQEEARTVRLKVVREGGDIGDVTVWWDVLGYPENITGDDLLYYSGFVEFSEGQKEAWVIMEIKADHHPELDETLVVTLVNITQGTLGDSTKLRGAVIIEANDDPYGTYIISSQSRTITVPEQEDEITVIVERTLASGLQGTVRVSYSTLTPLQAYPHLPGGTARGSDTDYVISSGHVDFSPNVTSQRFNVTVLDDDVPEIEETFFVLLTSVELLEGAQDRTVFDSPRLGDVTQCYSQIIISANDLPFGRLQLSSASVRVSEDKLGSVLSVVRDAGAYGTVSVKFEVVGGSATFGLDFRVTGSEVILDNDVREAAIPLDLINDALPELEESFTVRLLDQLTGGATLGPLVETHITILESDDPYGAFGFEMDQLAVTEPDDGSESEIRIPVVRMGGTVDVITVDWEASLSGAAPDSDLSPTSGSIFFVSNQARELIAISVLDDGESEGVEDVDIRLTYANGGGRVDSERNSFRLRILPNDNPHGMVQFGLKSYQVEERVDSATQFIPITRVGGSYGQLRVYYVTEQVNLLEEALVGGKSIYSYYFPPRSGKPLPQAGTRWDVTSEPDPLEACATFCLLTEACKSYDYNSRNADCTWFTTYDYEYLDNRTGYIFYVKDLQLTDPLYSSVALAGLDYTEVDESSVILDEDAESGRLPVTIISDTLPELPERFRIRLTSVELVGGPPLDPGNVPTIGSISEAVVTIASNDDANGVFKLYSRDPRATDSGRALLAEEREQFSVELVVERQGGSIGDVSVTWVIVTRESTAVRDADYVADGATFTFTPSQRAKTFTIGIEDDSLPENDETIVIELTDPQGGATIGEFKRVTVTIAANDYVAGLIGFTEISHLAKEGDVVVLEVVRTSPALGRVTIDWMIEAVESQPPATRFRSYSGKLYFDEGEKEKRLTLQVLVDNTPKVNQEYKVILDNVITEGIRETGAAATDSQTSVAVITIEGGNDPHGVISLAASSRNLRVLEGEHTLQISLDRKFGAIGVVRVYYVVEEGFITSSATVKALEGKDFTSEDSGIVTLYDGETTGTITVPILEDELPEVDEVFIIRLLRLELLSPLGSTFTPRLASSGTETEVTIVANDGTQGEVIFSEESARVTVDEASQLVRLLIKRNKGTFGSVSVFCFSQSTASGAVQLEDYKFEPREVYFGAGVTEQVVEVEILQDPNPEPEESLTVVLASPKNGLLLGEPHKATVVIRASDQASGVVNFDLDTVVILTEPAAGGSTSGSRGLLQLVRGPGVFGEVSVPYHIVDEDGQTDVTDVSPGQGVVTFRDRQATAILEISATGDDAPEEDETFTVILDTPDGGAELGPRSQRTLVVERNDAPYGLLQIYPAETRDDGIVVEEGDRLIDFDIVRSHGALDHISVDLVTDPDTASSQAGETLLLAVIQQLSQLHAVRWYSYVAHEETYVLMLTSTATESFSSLVGSDGAAPDDTVAPSMVYRWQGVLVPVQTLETDGATNAVSFTIGGVPHLLVINAGSPGSRHTSSRLYRMTSSGSPTLIQNLATEGASDACYSRHDDDHYVFVTSSVNNAGQSTTRSSLYVWDDTRARLTSVPTQYVNTKGAQSVTSFSEDGDVYIMVANHYDSASREYDIQSVVYTLDETDKLTVHQHLSTRGAADVHTFEIEGERYVAVAETRDNVGNTHHGVTVYIWNVLTRQLSRIQQIPGDEVVSVSSFNAWDKVFLTVGSASETSSVLMWNFTMGQFTPSWTGNPSANLIPLRASQSDVPLHILLHTPPMSNSEPQQLVVYEVAMLGSSDFVPRSLRVSFQPDQTQLTVGVYLLQDSDPEDTETFRVKLVNPRHGAEIGSQDQVLVTIPSNDDGHGIIQFAEDSLLRYEEELPGQTNTVQLNVVRVRGTSGRVVARWRATGDHSGVNDLTPLEGLIEFADGQAAATISLSILDDDLAEVEELTLITLVDIPELASDDPDLGAKIGTESTCRLTVLANDSPHGVVMWEKTVVLTGEPDGSDGTVPLQVVRRQGSRGHITIHYTTLRASTLPLAEQAVSGSDYVATQGSVNMADTVTRATIQFTIKQDTEPETAESFWVELTEVNLLSGEQVQDVGPSIRHPGNLATITIIENDNARGMIQFDVMRSIEGRVDTYEGVGSVTLRLRRSVGLYGSVEVQWQAAPREADNRDYSPTAGYINFIDGQETAEIVINILDDDQPENLQTFDVELIRVSAGGATLGGDTTVRLGILKSDSPNGVFSFVAVDGKLEKTVEESVNADDPAGVVSFDIERRGTDGEVTVQWRLSATAVDDFIPPLSGDITFSAGMSRRTVTLRTRPDLLLEGEERYTLSLVTADNNGDIHPTLGDATIIILPDEGAAGQVSMVTHELLLSEPGAGSDGEGQIWLTRGQGIHGQVKVTWQILPRGTTDFTQTQGEVVFEDTQHDTIIVIQTKDDSEAELRETFTVELTSVTGGATIDALSRTAEITVTASDYPHGLFEFSQPREMTVQEDSTQVQLTVVRNYGSSGQVRVHYTTSPDTAREQEDYLHSDDWLVFTSGQTEHTITVTLVNNDDPEPPQMFFVNLTQQQLQFPTNNNYTLMNGLQLDMAPDIGPLDSKIVIIDKNDQSEGIIQFTSTSIIVEETAGTTRVPVRRGPGSYGEVSVTYEANPGTATNRQDYLLPDGKLVLSSGMATNTINVSIIDDDEREFDEKFTISLLTTSGGVVLGELTTIDVIISTSDYPNGKFGFTPELERTLPNPDSSTTVTLSIERSEGLQGRQTVSWRILGPNNPNRVLEETNDVSHYNPSGQEVTRGQMVWSDDEDGQQTIALVFKPHTGWEVAETFIIAIYDIQGFPASDGSGQADPLANSVAITVEKFGDPNGIVAFDGVAQVSRTLEEPESGLRTVTFPLYRREGTAGQQQVHWIISGATNPEQDFVATSGTAVIPGNQRSGQILLEVMAEDVPELDEAYSVNLVSVEGGAEISKAYNASTIIIRYNDFPHGKFRILSGDQTVVVTPGTLKRQVRLNITRLFGDVGRVRLSFSMRYDQAQSGISYLPSSGSVTFENGQGLAVVHVDLESGVYLGLSSTFTVTLTQVNYIGVGVTMPPELVEGETIAKVTVPAESANSEVGFSSTVIQVDEVTQLATVTIQRWGAYGSVNVDWQSGYPSSSLPAGFSDGVLAPDFGTLSMINGVESQEFDVRLTSASDRSELFTVHIPRPPSTEVGGGARVRSGRTVCRVEPYGVIRFTSQSRDVSVVEEEDAIVEVLLQIERAYGSQGNLQVWYSTHGGSALPGSDFVSINQAALTMDSQETTLSIVIQVRPDTVPETDEDFYVNLTRVVRLPSDGQQGISPRLSSLYSVAKVTIHRNSDPYGVLSLQTASDHVTEPGSVTLTITRTGGTFGAVSVRVRTVGGGESWDSSLTSSPSVDTEPQTIGQALNTRNLSLQALSGDDYQRLNNVLQIKETETQVQVTLYILDDPTAEPDEQVFVYITPVTEGVRVAQPATDNGRKGYVMVTIRKNDFWGGWVGFYPLNSSVVTVDEDKGQDAVLTVERRDAAYGELKVYWAARVSSDSDESRSSRIDLTQQLTQTSGSVDCPESTRFCLITVKLQQDQVPENSSWFLIELTGVSTGARIDTSRRYSNVTMLPSDHPNGLIQIAASSRHLYVTEDDEVAAITVQRLGYLGHTLSVTYTTEELSRPETVAGVTVYHALEGADYQAATGIVTFDAGMTSKVIQIRLDPAPPSDNPLPKMFRVELSSPSKDADLSHAVSEVVITDTSDLPVWEAWASAQTQSLNTNTSISTTASTLATAVQRDLTSDNLKVTMDILDGILDVAESTPLDAGARASILDVFCTLMKPGREDATRGAWRLAQQLERFAFSYLVHLQCDTCCSSTNSLLYGGECAHVKFGVAKWYPEDINGYNYLAQQDDSFEMPEALLRVQDYGRESLHPKCFAVGFVEYTSEQWFNTGSDDILLNNRVFSVTVRDHQPRLLTTSAVEYRVHTPSHPAKRAKCVYFEETTEQWTTGQDVCSVENNLGLALDDYVDCACRHMSLYAVRTDVNNPDLIGYPVWFHISCFICMAGLAMAVLLHLICSLYSRISANLLMHMFFAMFATELCYLIDAYLSPYHILDEPTEADGSNDRCIVMAVFLHYFFLSQFTWMMTQGINYWKILVMNDEHTERKFAAYFLLGWGLPGFMVALFYLLTYLVYRYATDRPEHSIYGDVNANQDICFISNAFTALAGVIAPSLLCLLVVGVVFIHAYQVSVQWQSYDDIYRGRYNRYEVRAVLLFYALMTLTWLWGGLHMAYSQVWMLVLFCIFNIFTGLYAFIMYGIVRNPCVPCLRSNKSGYTMNGHMDNSDMRVPIANTMVEPSMVSTLKESKASLLPEIWEKGVTPASSTLRVKRTSPSQEQRKGSAALPASMSYSKPPSQRTDGQDSQDFTDLIYALKTGGYNPPSDSYTPTRGTRSRRSQSTDMERKRIDIADTHI